DPGRPRARGPDGGRRTGLDQQRLVLAHPDRTAVRTRLADRAARVNMSGMHNPMRTMSAVLLAAGAVIAGASAGPAAADDCPDVELIFARGTGEPPGVGRVGQALADAMAPQLGGRSLDVYA